MNSMHQTNPPMTVALMGLGRMGKPIARNIARMGFPLVVYNRTRRTAEEFAASTPARVAGSPAEAAAAADVLITLVANPAALDDLYDGSAGALRGLRPGSLAIEMSTVGPSAVRALREKLATVGVGLIDAPVVGNDSAAAAARLVVLVGGEPSDVERVRPILEVLGPKMLHVGPSGAGAALKLAINTVVHGLNECVAEALLLAEHAGVARSVTYEALLASTLGSSFLEHRRPAYVQPGSMPVAFRLALARKDLQLALDLAAELGSSMPQAKTNLRILAAAAEAGYADDDESGVITYLAHSVAMKRHEEGDTNDY